MPGEAYWAGLKFVLLPATIWLAAPLVIAFFIPIYRGLELFSIYEYLELRFDSKTRLAGSLVFVVWRLLWLGGVLYAPCKLLTVAANVEIPLWLLISITGLVATAYTFLGGMKAVIWTDVVQAFVMLAGVLVMIAAAWWNLQGGAARVWEVATVLDRGQLMDTAFRWDSYWTVWGIVPHFFLSMLSFYAADQITAQRYLTARTLRDAQRSFLLNCVSVSIMVPCLAYVGLCLLAFYHDHPAALRTKWIVNVDGETRRSMTYADRDRLLRVPSSDTRPLLDWNDPRDS
jgi:Na+/proline symporter